MSAAHCVPTLDPRCLIGPIVSHGAGKVAGGVTSGVLSTLASGIQSGIHWMITGAATWWIEIPSPNLASQPAVGQLQQWMLPIAAAVAVLSMIIAGGKMAITRKAAPLADVGSGLAIIAVTTAIGVLLPTLLLRAGDAWSSWVLNASSGGHFAQRLAILMEMTGSPASVVVVLGVIAIIIGAIQAILMLFRQAALIVLAGVLPLAAVGTLNPGTRAWFRKVTSWGLALIFYKVAAAAVYATAFTLVGTGSNVQTILMGFAMMLLSLIALPVLMKFFTWTTGAVADSASGGGFLQTAMGGVVAMGALRAYGGGGGATASDQARSVSDQLSPSGASSPGGGSARPTPGSGADVPHPEGAASSGSTAATAGVPSGAAGSGAGAMSGAAAGSGASAAAGSGAGAAGAGAAAGGAAAAGPAGVVIAGLAAGAKSAGNAATGAMQPNDGG